MVAALRVGVLWRVAAVDSPLRQSLSDLVESIAEHGDRSSFASVFRAFAPKVKSFLIGRGASSELAEEVTQEVMLQVWRNAGQYNRQLGSVSTWIFCIARNRYIDRIRHERRPEFDPNDPHFAPFTDGSASMIESSLDGEKIRTALHSLPESQADVLRANMYDGQTLGEIAREKNLPLGTVETRLRLGISKLRAIVLGEERT